MSVTRLRSIAEQEAEARKDSVLLNYAYLYTTAKGTLLQDQRRAARPELLTVFEELVEAAAKYKRITGRHLPILGELGELFAEIMFGLKRHNPMTQGSDGKLGDDLVEVKTITPDKTNDTVQVKRAGNFEKLIVVKITDDFQFGARMVHRHTLKTGRRGFDEISWADMIVGEPDQMVHRNFPINRIQTKSGAGSKDRDASISSFLNDVLQDWRASKGDYPRNTFPLDQWPIPFFGNPRTAIVATVGVNPASSEFDKSRNWDAVQNPAGWKRRLRDYFNCQTPSHRWFRPWRVGLDMLGAAYEAGTAAHFDVSYRATIAMLRNQKTDAKEFRHMVERDVAWFFRLLLLSPNLRLILTFGPIVGSKYLPETLSRFLIKTAPLHGFKACEERQRWCLRHETTGKVIFVHNADTPGEKSITSRVMKNLETHGEKLRRLLATR